MIDCMTCLVNITQGLEVEDNQRLKWQGMTHAAVYEMGPGRLGIACHYTQVNIYGIHYAWQYEWPRNK